MAISNQAFRRRCISWFATLILALCAAAQASPALGRPNARAAATAVPLVFVDGISGAPAGQDGLFLIADDGTNRRPLAGTATGITKRFPAWSPDHTSVAYQAQLKDFPAVGQHPAVIATYNLESGRSALLTEGPLDESVSWDPSGTELLFVSLLGPAGSPSLSVLTRVGATGGDASPLVQPLAGPDRHFEHPAWSPDGKRIAVVVVTGMPPASEGEIYLLDAATGEWSRPLPHPGWDDRDPAWSPDGRALAFASAPVLVGPSPRVHNLWRLDLGTGVAGTIVTDTGSALHDLRRPAWSPDGARLVFDAAQVEDTSRTLHLVAATGGHLAPPLTTGWDADWSGAAPGAAPTASPTAPLPTPTAGSPLPTVPGSTRTPPGEPTFPTLPTLPPLPTFPPPEPTLGPPPPTFPPPTIPAGATPARSATPTGSPVPTQTLRPTPPTGDGLAYLPVGYRLVTTGGEEATPSPSASSTAETTPTVDVTPARKHEREGPAPRLGPGAERITKYSRIHGAGKPRAWPRQPLAAW